MVLVVAEQVGWVTELDAGIYVCSDELCQAPWMISGPHWRWILLVEVCAMGTECYGMCDRCAALLQYTNKAPPHLRVINGGLSEKSAG